MLAACLMFSGTYNAKNYARLGEINCIEEEILEQIQIVKTRHTLFFIRKFSPSETNHVCEQCKLFHAHIQILINTAVISYHFCNN